MTRADLEQLPDRELDALVAELVFGIEARVPKRCMHTGAIHHEETVVRGDLPFYSSSWAGFGLMVERMRELGFGCELSLYPDGFDSVCFTRNFKSTHIRDDRNLMRAAATAAVLAMQAVEP